MTRRQRRRARRLAMEAEQARKQAEAEKKAEEEANLSPEEQAAKQDEIAATRPKRRRDVMAAARQNARAMEEISEAQEAEDPPKRSETKQFLVPHKQNSPAKTEPKKNMPYTFTEEEREAEIAEIQRELVQRRRRRWMLLWLRLAFFIALPTFLVGNFFYNHATPLFSSKSAFVIERASGPAALGGGGLFTGTSFATSRESIAVQDFLVSLEAMRILDSDLEVIDAYSDPKIDPIQRLSPDATESDAYSIYRDRVLVGFDTTEGIIRLEVIAPNPALASAMSLRLIELAEFRVAQMSDRNRADALRTTEEAVEDARRALDEAEERVLQLQEAQGIFSAEIELSLVQSTISSLTAMLEEKRLELAALNDNTRPNPAQVRIAENEIARIEASIAEQRAKIVNASAEQTSLARQGAELERAQANAELARVILTGAIQSREIARQEANQQALYLSMVVNPVEPQVASYPRKFEYTALAFVIFFAIYMMASLTISILREQMAYGTTT
jgi:capsular polysaccharide transport system permease protein